MCITHQMSSGTDRRINNFSPRSQNWKTNTPEIANESDTGYISGATSALHQRWQSMQSSLAPLKLTLMSTMVESPQFWSTESNRKLQHKM